MNEGMTTTGHPVDCRQFFHVVFPPSLTTLLYHIDLYFCAVTEKSHPRNSTARMFLRFLVIALLVYRLSGLPPVSTTATSPSTSQALLSILGDESNPDEFFESVWQKTPHVFRSSSAPILTGSSTSEDPLHNQVTMGLPGITRVLDNACQAFLEPPSSDMQNTLPMVFNRQRQSLSLQELVPLYGNNLFKAYLDGCSVVLNHCDRLCPCTAALCEDLQRTFPYAYANAYLTPPASQTVPAHADDRDVFVIQVYGKKKWKVYEHIPIEYPYPHEQVGKNGLPVPKSVTDGPCSVETVLHPGQVLYIPRGHVHEACTDPESPNDSSEPSYHITIALATFDWAWSGLLATRLKQTLDSIPEYRMAVPIDFGTTSTDEIPEAQKECLEAQVDRALALVRAQLTTDSVNSYLTQKYQFHASRSRADRLARIDASHGNPTFKGSGTGAEALPGLSLSSFVRARRPEESEGKSSGTSRGIRPETRAALESIVEYLELDPANTIQIADLRAISRSCDLICDLTLLCFIRSCIERGELVRVS